MTIKCPECGSKDIRKTGTQIRARKPVQKYICKKCYRIFTEKGKGK